MVELFVLREKSVSYHYRMPPAIPFSTPPPQPPEKFGMWNSNENLRVDDGNFKLDSVGSAKDQSARIPPPSRSCRLPRSITSMQPYLTLVNSGSVARDHLASERTFLAYVRTSLATAAMGVALVQLFTISCQCGNTSGIPNLTNSQMHIYARRFGATAVLFALIVLAVGVTRYFTIQNALTKGNFPVARTVTVGLSVILMVLVIVTFAVSVTFRRLS